MEEMISVERAKELFKNHITSLLPKNISVSESIGLILAEDIISPINLPPFDQSAMDGYGFVYDDLINNNIIRIIETIGAGDLKERNISVSEAFKIFTGAAVPKGADTVIPVEKALDENGYLTIKDKEIKRGANIRLKGSHIKAGSIALWKGTKINPAAVGLLTGMGINEVSVIPFPRILLIITGDELVMPGEALKYGQIYESNGFMLEAAIKTDYRCDVKTIYCGDSEQQLYDVFTINIPDFDLVIITGGISAGDYDYTKPALEKAGVQHLFHKVKQKPGKPLYFGSLKNKPVIGLPGNPAAVLTCYYIYLRDIINQLIGDYTSNTYHQLPLANAYSKKSGLTHFVKGIVKDGTVNILGGQESYILKSFAEANCLVTIPPNIELINKDNFLEVLMI